METAFKHFPYFKNIKETVLQEFYQISLIKSFNDSDVILGIGIGYKNYVHFILHGKCIVVDILKIKNSPEIILAKTCLFLSGATFNVGREMDNRCVIAKSKVTCLLIPKERLLKLNCNNIWCRIEMLLYNSLPKSNHELRNELEKERKWNKYKNNVIMDILTKSN